jgi:hypothetical protein
MSAFLTQGEVEKDSTADVQKANGTKLRTLRTYSCKAWWHTSIIPTMMNIIGVLIEIVLNT